MDLTSLQSLCWRSRLVSNSEPLQSGWFTVGQWGFFFSSSSMQATITTPTTPPHLYPNSTPSLPHKYTLISTPATTLLSTPGTHTLLSYESLYSLLVGQVLPIHTDCSGERVATGASQSS